MIISRKEKLYARHREVSISIVHEVTLLNDIERHVHITGNQKALLVVLTHVNEVLCRVKYSTGP